MFEDLRDASIKIHDQRKKHLIYIPNVISVEPLNNLYDATEWLVNEAVKDYNRTYARVEKRRKEHGYSQKNLDDIDALGIRIGSRTQGYVNQLCLAEDLLIFEYGRMCDFLKEASGGKISPSLKQDTEHLIKAMEPIRIFRNKVVAHTAYTKPKIDKKTRLPVDNPETVVRSILNLFPQSGDIKLGNNFFSGFSKWQSELPVITIYSWEEHAKKILIGWKHLFLKTMLDVHKLCPLENEHYKIDIAYRQKARQVVLPEID